MYRLYPKYYDDGSPSLPLFNSASFASAAFFAIAAVLLIGALIYFAFIAFKSATVYYYTVGELNEKRQELEGETIRVSGKLIPDSYKREITSTMVRFTLTDTDTGESLPAIYNGVLPDLFFNEHSEIILEGDHRSDGVFHGQNVIVKCPSKYVELSQESAGASQPAY